MTETKADDKAGFLMFGTGEYTTGYVHGAPTTSDKTSGVVALTFFDLRKRGKVGSRAGLCGTSGTKLPDIRKHMQKVIAEKYSLDISCECFPADDCKSDPQAYVTALKAFKPGDIAVIFTPDDTHFDICMAAIKAGLHVMVTKPMVKTLAEHRLLLEAARKHNVLIALEVHKRYDPIYSDAVNRMRALGDFGFFQAYMSQPKSQLLTFKSWAGKSSDISYYLNSHHIDLSEWALHGIARPERVTAIASTGVCKAVLGVDAEDTITLTVQWRNLGSGALGTAIYTSSWAAAKSDVHSQQRFHYMGHKGEINVDQAHRGASVATDATGFASFNPLYMRYTPDSKGRFVGQGGYGYKSFEVFVDAVNEIRARRAKAADFDGDLPTVGTTLLTTAILEAGRLSLDADNAAVAIDYNKEGEPVALRVLGAGAASASASGASGAAAEQKSASDAKVAALEAELAKYKAKFGSLSS